LHRGPAHRCPSSRAVSAEETGGSGERAGDATELQSASYISRSLLPKSFSPDASILSRRRLRQKLVAVLAVMAIYRQS